jgi:serine/threonine-protein kinase RsbW
MAEPGETQVTTSPLSGDAVDATMPLRTGYAATMRVLVASLGADAGFTVEELDDLRLAVSEVFSTLVEAEHGDSGRCEAHIDIEPGLVRVSLRRVGSNHSDRPIELDALAGTILGSVVDEHTIEPDGVSLLKRAAASPAISS